VPEVLEKPSAGAATSADYVDLADLAILAARGTLVVKHGRKQIALFHREGRVYACNNRCPHEGYPLSEGTLSDDASGRSCLLTCNWHNWKFDLESGETLVGGDRLRRYPVRLAEGRVWVDVSDPPPQARIVAALEALHDSFRRHEYDRMAREIARIAKAGGDPLAALRAAIHWTHDRLEFGTTHAHAAAADWLALRDTRPAGEAAARLVPLTEIVGHLAWDSLREPQYPFPAGHADYAPAALVAAIEAEDEATAVAQLRGALAAGLDYAVLEAPLAEAALAHYADFGHSAIYVYKVGQLVARLGPEVAEPLLLALVRSLIYATREDLIPEFRDYTRALADWPRDAAPPAQVPRAEEFIGLSVRAALNRCRDFAGGPKSLHRALLGAAGWSLLHFDRAYETNNDGPVSDNVGWLDFTHAITFANAVRVLCRRYPALWPQGLLQIACFLGRNAPYIKRELDTTPWRVDDPAAFRTAITARLLDHGQFEYIVACHLLKLATAVQEEIAAAPEAPWRADLLAGLNRLLNTPIKRKFTLRTARQSLDFVARED